jgi:hypothetical protein
MSFREERRLLADYQRLVVLTGPTYCPTNSQPEFASHIYVENWMDEERRLLADFDRLNALTGTTHWPTISQPELDFHVYVKN